MSRHKSCEAIVLHQAPLSEIHASITLLCRDEGVIRVVAHGIRGKKSSLRAHCQTYAKIRVFVYEDTQRQTRKLSDAELVEDFAPIRENLQSIYNAALCAEVLAKSPLQAEDEWAYDLFAEWLKTVSGVKQGALTENATIQFMWRYLDRSGFMPDLNHCVQSGSALDDSDKVSYSASLGGFIAIGRSGESGGFSRERQQGGRIEIPAGALPYLRFSLSRDFGQAVQVGLAGEARKILLRLSLDLVQDTLGYPLKSLRDIDLLFAPA